MKHPQIILIHAGRAGQIIAWLRVGCVAALGLMGAPALVHAGEWQCSNKQLEIHCLDGRCEQNAAFTPMDIALDSRGTLRVCAYSKCWTGKGRAVRERTWLAILANRLEVEPQDPKSAGAKAAEAAGAAVVLNLGDGVGLLKLEAFAHPIQCHPADKRRSRE